LADDITILVDVKAICFLRQCKYSAGILLRSSLELSKYNCIIVNVPEENNEVSDVLSRHHEGIDKVVKESKTTAPMTEKHMMNLIKRLKIPQGYQLKKRRSRAHMLRTTSLPNPTARKRENIPVKLGKKICNQRWLN
jgi:hypothetical protein